MFIYQLFLCLCLLPIVTSSNSLLLNIILDEGESIEAPLARVIEFATAVKNNDKLEWNNLDAEVYIPARGAIFSYKDHQEIRKVDNDEKEWILQNCRCQKE